MPSALHKQNKGTNSRVSRNQRESSYCSGSMVLGSRRRTAGARVAGSGGKMLLILAMMLASTEAFLFKRWAKGGLSAALSKRGTGGREKVRFGMCWVVRTDARYK